MKILVTGANGYLGSALVTKCIDSGYETVAVDINNTYIDKRAKYKNIDIFDPNIDFYEEFERPDVLIHLAWRNGFVHKDTSHIIDLPSHYLFIEKMINSGVKFVSVMGSMHEIGYHEGMIDENTPCKPLSIYGIAKNALRESLECLLAESDVNFHWLRAYYIIGNDVRSNSVFGKLLRKAMDGEKEFPLNSGKIKYDFISLDELCEQIIAASVQKKINGTINLCSGKPASLGERIEQFIKDNNLDIRIHYGVFPDRPYDSPVIYGDNSKITEIMKNTT